MIQVLLQHLVVWGEIRDNLRMGFSREIRNSFNCVWNNTRHRSTVGVILLLLLLLSSVQGSSTKDPILGECGRPHRNPLYIFLCKQKVWILLSRNTWVTVYRQSHEWRYYGQYSTSCSLDVQWRHLFASGQLVVGLTDWFENFPYQLCLYQLASNLLRLLQHHPKKRSRLLPDSHGTAKKSTNRDHLGI